MKKSVFLTLVTLFACPSSGFSQPYDGNMPGIVDHAVHANHCGLSHEVIVNAYSPQAALACLSQVCNSESMSIADRWHLIERVSADPVSAAEAMTMKKSSSLSSFMHTVLIASLRDRPDLSSQVLIDAHKREANHLTRPQMGMLLDSVTKSPWDSYSLLKEKSALELFSYNTVIALRNSTMSNTYAAYEILSNPGMVRSLGLASSKSLILNEDFVNNVWMLEQLMDSDTMLLLDSSVARELLMRVVDKGEMDALNKFIHREDLMDLLPESYQQVVLNKTSQ